MEGLLEGNLRIMQLNTSEPKVRVLFYPYGRGGGVSDGPEFETIQDFFRWVIGPPIKLDISSPVMFQFLATNEFQRGSFRVFSRKKNEPLVEVALNDPQPKKYSLPPEEFLTRFNHQITIPYVQLNEIEARDAFIF